MALHQPLRPRRYAYVWADGIYLLARPEDDSQCEHQSDHGENDEGGVGAHMVLEFFGKAPASAEPNVLIILEMEKVARRRMAM